MSQDGFVAKKHRNIRFSVVALAFAVGLVAIGVVAAVQLTKQRDYWLGMDGLVVALLLLVMGRLWRGTSDSSPNQLDEVAEDLAKAVHDQWSRIVERISDPYPLKVRFSEVPAASVDPSSVYPRSKGTGVFPDGAGAQPLPPVPVVDEPLKLNGVFADIATVFTGSGLHERMVILGEPGSGKTMIAQWLTVNFVDSHPEMGLVPVLLSLATWDPEDPLEKWAETEMARTYPSLSRHVPAAAGNTERTLAYQLIAGKRVLMVLDGLDEMGTGNQCAALQKLSESAERGQHFVVTCRTKDYRRIVDQAGAPLAKTAVIALKPLAVDDIIQYLRDTPLLKGPSAHRWDRFVDDLVTEPEGPLAIAMTRPLVVWLVCTNYRRQETQPYELSKQGSADEITNYLLDGLVDAAYSVSVEVTRKRQYAALKPEGRKLQKERLGYFAEYLSRQNRTAGSQTKGDSIEWWYLPRDVPLWFTGGTIGLICGCLLGASGGVAAAIKFGHPVGVAVGIVLGIVAAIHAGTTSVRWQDVPRSIGFRATMTFPRFASCLAVAIGVAVCFGYAADRGGGLVVALVTAAVVGPLCAIGIKPTFGMAPAVATGITASIALGLGASLFGHRPAPLISAGAAGLTFLVSAWVFTGVFQNADSMKAVSPESLLRGDRDGSLIVALTAGLAFAVVFGLALGPLVGLLAFAGLMVTAAFTVSMWGAFTFTRVWLALRHKMPLNIIEFLREADSRGVLRREGGAFQFRHDELQDWLATPATQPILRTVPPSRTEAKRDEERV
jgi:hypothetical protein